MERKIRIAHWCFIASMSSWMLTMAITPVGGWSLSNPWRDYYMTAFDITGLLTLITLLICLKIDKL